MSRNRFWLPRSGPSQTTPGRPFGLIRHGRRSPPQFLRHSLRGQGGGTLLEFAIAWPVALLLIVGSVQLAVWGSEAFAAKQAALAGARAGIAAGGSIGLARSAALASLQPVLVGATAVGWCPSSGGVQPAVWVCVTSSATTIEVRVGGSVPAMVPLLSGAHGLPLGADVTLERETFQ